jgi:y4mF family transcriptional regulator
MALYGRVCRLNTRIARKTARSYQQTQANLTHLDQREVAMGNSLPDELAAEARARRGSLRLSQRELAELAGVSERFVRFVEQGKRTVQLDSLLALLDTLGLELRVQTRTSAAARALAGPLAGSEARANNELPANSELRDGPEVRP